jgi:hypothetical protein
LAKLAALGVWLAPAATIGGESPLQEEVATLRQRLADIESRRARLLNREIEQYLAESAASHAQGGALWMDATTIHARFTAVVQGTVDYCDENCTNVNGDVDLDFDFKVTDHLDLFVYTTANTDEHFEPLPDGALTGAGMTDSIGVDGTKPVRPGSLQLREAGIHHRLGIGDKTLHWEIGQLDPRLRFGQNAFAGDENTQFIHNLFDDASSMLWLSDASGRTTLGLHFWIALSDSVTLSWGWWNTPGQWFNNGQALVQLHWKGQISGRETNLRLYGWIDEFFEDGAGDGSSGGGASWDWWLSEKIGIFATIAATGGEVNPVEMDAAVGLAWTGLWDRRPDDTLGVAVGFVSLQDGSTLGSTVFPEDTELHLEIYWRLMFEESRLQVTPHVIAVTDPNGGLATNDQLWILGLRIFVPF